MATVGTLANLFNLAQLKDPRGGGIMQMIFSMAEMQDILQDMPFFPANDKTSHKFVRSTKLVTGTWTDVNDGITASKGQMKSYRTNLGRLESRLTIDNRMMNQETNFGAFVERMAHPHYEGLGQQMADAYVLGSNSGGQQFNGIEAHITSASQTDEAGRKMFQTYAGTGSDLASILAVDWGMDKVYSVYPQGHAYVGVQKDEHPQELITGNNSAQLFAYLCDFKWVSALVIADDRCVRRAGNIDSSGTTNNLLSSSYETDPIVDMLGTMRNLGRDATLYMNRTIWSQFWKVTKDKTNVNYTAETPWKQPEMLFGNNRIRITDSLLDTETAVS